MARPGDGDVVVRVLGPVALEARGEPVRLSALERSLLARVALTSTVAPASLEPWLWGQDPPSSAPNRIQALVSGIRRKCSESGVSPLVTEGGGYRLDAAVAVDLFEHQELRGRGRVLAAAGSTDCLEVFQQALALGGDEPLEGIAPTPAVEIERDLLVQGRLTLWEEYADACLALGRAESVLADLASLTAKHPFREVLVAQYMLALSATGQQEQALRLYRTAYDRLDEELGVTPSSRLREAHAQVLDGGPAAPEDDAAPTAPAGHTAVPVAGHGLPVPRTLPRRAPGFVGREDALEEIKHAALAADGSALVVQLVGLTGMGKSALAVEAGHQLRDQFPGGSLYFDAARDRDQVSPDAVVASFLRLMGVHPDAVPDDTEDRTALFRSTLDGRKVLIVLDGVEDAPDGSPTDVGRLLPASPGSMALVTSRLASTDLAADTQVRVGPLSTASSLALLRTVVGHDRVDTDLDGATQLVEVLSGMPLALRLVASRAAQRPDLTLGTVAAKVAEQGPSRGDGLDGLTAGLALVWDRLPDEAQQAAVLVAQLPTSTFSGWVPGSLLGDDEAGDRAMDALVASSLVEPVLRPDRTAQYRLHDVVTRLVVPRDETDTPGTLARVATDLLGRATVPHLTHSTQLVPLPDLVGTSRPAPLGRATTPRERSASREFFATENSLARACARHLARTRPDLAWRLLVVTAGAHHASPSERDWLAAVEVVEPLLGLDEDARLGAAHLALCRGWLLQSRTSSSAPARTLADQARRQLTLLGAHTAAAAAGVLCSFSSLSLGRRADAEADVQRAEASLVHVSDPVLAGWVAIARGTIHNDYDELADATQEFTRAREILSVTAARAAFGQATLELSRACRRRGALGPANVLVDEALALLDGEAEHDYTYALDARAEVSVTLGRGAEALEQADRAWGRASQAQDLFLTARSRRARAGALRLLGRLDEAAEELRTSVEEFTRIGRSLSVAASLRELALVLDLQGRHAEANEVYRQERAARASAQLVTDDDRVGTTFDGRTDGTATDA